MLLGMAIGANAQITKGAKGYTFRLKYTPGKTISNKMTITTGMDMGGKGSKPMSFAMNMPIKSKCTGQKGDVFTVVTTSGPMTMNGKPQEGAKAQTATVKINTQGQIIEGAAAQDMNLSSIKLPSGPIKVGDKWKGVINMPQNQGKVDATYQLNGVKMINGKECAIIGVAMVMSGGMGKMTGNGTINLLTADAQPLNMSMKLGGTVNAGAAGAGAGSGMKMNMSLNLVRL